MSDSVKLLYNGNEFQLPVIIGSEGEKAIDISKLRQETGLITLDTGYANTGRLIVAVLIIVIDCAFDLQDIQ